MGGGLGGGVGDFDVGVVVDVEEIEEVLEMGTRL